MRRRKVVAPKKPRTKREHPGLDLPIPPQEETPPAKPERAKRAPRQSFAERDLDLAWRLARLIMREISPYLQAKRSHHKRRET